MLQLSKSDTLAAATKWLKALHGKGFTFPNTYIVVDLETSGNNVFDSLILQFGYLIVQDGNIISAPPAVLLNWPGDRYIDQQLLRRDLYETGARMQSRGQEYKFTYDMLRSGVEPRSLLSGYLSVFREWQARNCAFVAHNGYRFDMRLIETHFKRYIESDFRFDSNQLIDTGLFEKSMQLKSPILPLDNQHMTAMYCDIADHRANNLWNLQKHCVEKYDLKNRFALDMRLAHTADFDCRVTHFLYQTYRDLALNSDHL